MLLLAASVLLCLFWNGPHCPDLSGTGPFSALSEWLNSGPERLVVEGWWMVVVWSVDCGLLGGEDSLTDDIQKLVP